MLVGRETECRSLDLLLETARVGKSSALVLRGEPGIGKSALLEFAVERAYGLRVLSARGAESESDLPFAALGDLLRPVMGFLEQITRVQADTLAGALALGPPVGGDRLGAYTAAMTLLFAAAEQSPLLVCIDDAQWVDEPSQGALGFVARRLDAEGVVMLFAVRAGDSLPARLMHVPVLDVGGLSEQGALQLLHSVVATSLAPGVTKRLLEASAGNPLALMELPEMLTPEQLAGVAPVGELVPPGPSLQQAFVGQVARLSEPTRTLLVVAAADRDVDDVLAAGERLGVGLSQLEEAEDAGILSLAQRAVRFRHPLLRSAAYHSAPATIRRRAHVALAAVLEGSAKSDAADRRARHLAAAAPGYDERVAAALDEAGTRAHSRSAFAAAAAAWRSSAELTAAAEPRARRLLLAADGAQLAGLPAAALALVEQASQLNASDELRSEALRLRSAVHMWSGGSSESRRTLIDAHLRVASAVGAANPDQAMLMLSAAAALLIVSARNGEAARLVHVGEAIPAPVSPAVRAVFNLFGGLALILTGAVREGVARVGRLQRVVRGLDPLSPLGQAAFSARPLPFLFTEDYARAGTIIDELTRVARARGSPTLSIFLFQPRFEVEFRTGRWQAARASVLEALALCEDSGFGAARSTLLAQNARLEAAQGHREECLAAVRDGGELDAYEASRHFLLSAQAVLDFSHRRFGEAIPYLEELDRLARRAEMNNPLVLQWEPDLVEAYIRTGRLTEAAERLDGFEDKAQRMKFAWSRATAARCRGLLAEGGSFEEHFAQALQLHDQPTTPFERARTQLCWGERLRRAGRVLEARTHLAEALDAFDRLEARPWSDQALGELRASGARVGPRTRVPWQQLTPQELQVALTVAGGTSNPEAAQALFISRKTVEYHLGNVYRKLGIRSRADLAQLAATGALS